MRKGRKIVSLILIVAILLTLSSMFVTAQPREDAELRSALVAYLDEPAGDISPFLAELDAQIAALQPTEPGQRGLVWVVQPTLEYERIAYCLMCEMFTDSFQEEIDRTTGRVVGIHHGHGGWQDLVYDPDRGLLGLGGSVHDGDLQMYPLGATPWNIQGLRHIERVDSSRRIDTWGVEMLADDAYTGEFAVMYHETFVTDFLFFAGADAPHGLNLIAMRSGHAWGLIDNNGNTVVPFVFEHIIPISEGTAFAMYNERYGILDLHLSTFSGDYDHRPPALPYVFTLSPASVANVRDVASAESEIRTAIQSLTPEQRTSGDALNTATLHIEHVARRGTSQTIPADGNLSADALRGGVGTAQQIRANTDDMLAEENVHLMRNLRTNVNFTSEARQEVAVIFPEDVSDVGFDNVTIESPFAAATVNREHIPEGGEMRLSRVERADEGESGGLSAGERVLNILREERSPFQMLQAFWALVLVALLLVAWVVLELMGKKLRMWVVPTFAVIALSVNGAVLWSGAAAYDNSRFYDDVIEVNMTEGMRVTLSLPIDGIDTDPANLILFNEQGEPQHTKYNPVTGTIDARIRTGGVYTLREHTVSFADIEGKSQLMQDAILALAARGIMRGTADGYFGPDDLITRGEFVSAIVMAFDMLDFEAETSFTDLSPAAWYYRAIATAEHARLIEGFADGTFRAAVEIPKDQLTVVAANVLMEQMGYLVPADIESILTRYQDREELPRWSEDAIALATASNVIIFRADSLFAPESIMTRGDAAVVLYRLFQRVW